MKSKRMLLVLLALCSCESPEGLASGEADLRPPSVPGDLRVLEATASSISLSWSASTDEVAVAGYEVSKDGALAMATGGTTAKVGSLAASTTYTFQVRARDVSGNASPLSAPVEGTTQSVQAIGLR